ncbi:hypothetical protein [Lysobacter sp. TAB13]|uniref:hypothetical protein n=1 Tax=Lysobacter sp. TAB13 TaxID=3233065 RepID=UPI003F9A9554
MRSIVINASLTVLLALGAAGGAVAQPPAPAAAPILDEVRSRPRLGVYYFDPANNNSEEWGALAGLVGWGINRFINATPALKRASVAERDRIAVKVDVPAERAALLGALRADAAPALLVLRYGMSQDMSALMVLAELRSPDAPHEKPVRLAYQSPVHELQAKTAQQIQADVADVERRKPELSAREYRKALEQANSPQRDWPAIYRAHAQHWLDDDAAALRLALAQARERMEAMIEFARANDSTLSATGLLPKVGETLSRDGELRSKVEAADLIVAKRSDDPEYYLGWTTFLADDSAAR